MLSACAPFFTLGRTKFTTVNVVLTKVFDAIETVATDAISTEITFALHTRLTFFAGCTQATRTTAIRGRPF
jgi:hypothetical protein